MCREIDVIYPMIMNNKKKKITLSGFHCTYVSISQLINQSKDGLWSQWSAIEISRGNNSYKSGSVKLHKMVSWNTMQFSLVTRYPRFLCSIIFYHKYKFTDQIKSPFLTGTCQFWARWISKFANKMSSNNEDRLYLLPHWFLP